MPHNKSSSFFISSKVRIRISEQFFFYTNIQSQKSISLRFFIDLFFSNFTHTDIKLLICSFFLLDQIIGHNNFSLKFKKYKHKREKRVSLTIRWTVNQFSFFQNWFTVSLPKTPGLILYFNNLNNPVGNLCLSFKTILSMVPYLQNYKQFQKFFELKNPSLYFSFYLFNLKHNLILKNYLSYLGLFVI